MPNQLVLKSTSTPSLLQSSFLFIPDLLRQLLPEKAMKTIAIKEQLQDLQELLQGKSKTNGWQMFAQPNVILESLGRDEFKLNESKVWPNFTDR